MRRATTFDLVGAVEAIYRIEQPTKDWLHGTIDSLRPLLDDGLGLYAHTYRVDAAMRVSDATFASLGCSDAVQAAFPAVLEANPDFVRDSFLSQDVRATSSMPSWVVSPISTLARSLGVHDCWGINGRNFDRRGVVIIANRRRAEPIPAKLSKTLTRIAAHLAASARLRHRSRENVDGNDGIEAVLTPGGRVEHAVGEARTKSSLCVLSESTLAREAATGRLRHDDPTAALKEWRGRVAARWTLVDSFEKDGKRYVVARENTSPAGSADALSARERQVLSSAALGRSNKEIAYDLGIGHSTVRVLLARAARKLCARTRDELLSKFELMAMGS